MENFRSEVGSHNYLSKKRHPVFKQDAFFMKMQRELLAINFASSSLYCNARYKI